MTRGEQEFSTEVLFFLGFIEIVPHPLFMGIGIKMTAFVFLSAAAPADIVPAHFGLFIFGDFVPTEQTLQ
jgi:hypothetical protein